MKLSRGSFSPKLRVRNSRRLLALTRTVKLQSNKHSPAVLRGTVSHYLREAASPNHRAVPYTITENEKEWLNGWNRDWNSI